LINKVVVISFNWQFLREFRALERDQALGALGRPTRLADGSVPLRRSRSLSGQWLDPMAATGAQLVVWNQQVSAASVAEAHLRGLKVWIYTVNEVRLAAKLLDAGVDGIITNHIPRMKEYLRSR
jgi:glycerophosphoryl diester phosphodiesterase